MSVSVCIPAYNAAEFLREAIESALGQTRPPDEVLVVDDGSTDHTREVCEGFGARVRYVRQENDGTLGAGARARA
ncbi:MAG TPA: glycosyltransferase, partial [Pyrinomonadaceae bacterium]|nr:glycosyltransferase [Pyrinomonadaceae bacterium]